MNKILHEKIAEKRGTGKGFCMEEARAERENRAIYAEEIHWNNAYKLRKVHKK